MPDPEGNTPVGIPEGFTPVPDEGKMPVPGADGDGEETGAPLPLLCGAPVPDGKNEADGENPLEMV